MEENSKEKLRIVLVQDAIEQTRQPLADILVFFKQAIQRICGENRSFYLENVSGSSAERALNSLDAGSVDLIIFASNAMIRQDGEIFQCFEQNALRIRDYVYDGGGMLIFHQGFSGSESGVEALKFTGAKRYLGRDRLRDFAQPSGSFRDKQVFDSEHVLLNYPHKINLDDLREDERGLTRLGVPFGYFTVEPFTKNDILSPAAQLVDGHYTLATFEARGRVVFSAYPADWAKHGELMENLISYGLFGKPDAVLIRENSGSESKDDYWEMMRIRLENSFNLGTINTRALPNGTLTSSELSDSDRYVLANTEIALLDSPITPSEAKNSQIVQRILRKGGAVIAADLLSDSCGEIAGSEYFTGFIGIGKNPTISKNLEDLTSAITGTGWFKEALIHDLRDAILGINLIADSNDYFSSKKVAKTNVQDRVKSWFESSVAALDPGTALTAAWLYAVTNESKSLPISLNPLVRELETVGLEREFDVLYRCLLNGAREISISEIISTDNPLSWGSLIRCIDVMRMLEALGCKIKTDRNERGEICKALIENFSESPDLIDQSGYNIAALLSTVTILSSWQEGYGKGARRVVAQIAACAQRILDTSERNSTPSLNSNVPASQNCIGGKGGDDKPNEKNQNGLNEEDKAHVESQKIRSLLAMAVLTEIDKYFPSGVTNLISQFLSTNGNTLQIGALSEKAVETIRSKAAIIELRARVSELEARTEKLTKKREKFGHEAVAFLKPWVIAGSFIIWFSVLLTLTLIGWFLYESAISFFNQGDFTDYTGMLLAALPIGTGYIWFLASHDFLSGNPIKLALNKSRKKNEE